MKKHHILLDYENVQPKSLPSMDREEIYLTVFLGPNQPRVPVELVMRTQPMGNRARYLRLATGGMNALDFVIAFTAGEILAADPDASICIITKDKGFDPLLEHLWSRKIKAERHASLDSVQFLQTAAKQSLKPLGDRVQSVAEHFSRAGVSKPRTLKTLKNTIHSLFKKALQEDEIDSLVEELKRRKFIAVTDNKVEHAWPAASAASPAKA
ncbi:MAG: hypothetical protein KIT83_04250 [Bryobacterales bacterium]|nr:hypothetical protein [Bryobacterales bacterium]